MTWAWWVVIALAALAGELATLGLFLACFAVAGFAAALLSLVAPLPVQVVAFALLALLLLLLVRPLALRVLPVSGHAASDPRVGPIGAIGTATERIDRGRGQIRVGAGEFWTARPAEPGMVVLPGQEVEIVDMNGLTALVRRTSDERELSVDIGGNDFGLSAREIDVVTLICEGMTNAEIADRLVVSPRTVHHHVSHILTKMNADNRAEVVRLAMESGLVRRADGAEGS